MATVDTSVRYLLLDQIRELQQLGHDVTAICAPGPRVAEMRRLGLKVTTVPMVRELHPLKDLKSLMALYDLFRLGKFDVVHSHTPKAGILTPLAARLARVPVVVHTVHGLLFHDRMSWWRQGVYWMPEKWTAKLSDCLLSQSREDISTAVDRLLCAPTKIRYIGNGIDTHYFSLEEDPTVDARERMTRGIRPDDFVVGCVGRLVYEKGFKELFEAMALLRAIDQIKFLIVGPEEPEQNDAVPHSQVEMLRRDEQIRLVGFQEDLRPWYRIMDVLVLPSHREGIPRACMEAAAMRRPIIATDIRGCREVIRHRKTGLLVPVGDPKALAAAILELWRDPARRLALGAEGQRHIQTEFDSSLVIERLGNFYASLQETILKRSAVA